MNPFVNPKKRGITLPAGCKELIDLLEPGKRREAKELSAALPRVELSRNDSFMSPLSEIGKPISSALESQSQMALLAIASSDDQVTISIYCMAGKVWSASVTFLSSPPSEGRMKALFERIGLKVPEQSGFPGDFLKDQPVYAIYHFEPGPFDCVPLTELVTAIFRDFCGMEPNAELEVHFVEAASR